MSEIDVGLSELPDGWVWTTVKEIAEFIRGVSYKKSESSKTIKEDYVPILRANNINRELNYADLVYVRREKIKDEQFVKAFDIVIAMSSGSKNLVGKAAQSDEDYRGAFGTFCGLVRVALQLDRKFIGFFFQSPGYRNEISRLSSGMNINNLRRQHIESMCLPIPPLSEQHRIVAKFEELFTQLDTSINLLQEVQFQLKRYRQSVLKSAFEGKLAEAWRVEHQGETEPTVPIADDLPNGWTWTTVEKIAQQIHYGYTESATNDPIGPKFLRITDIQNNSVNWDSVPYCRIDEVKQQQYLLKENDLVFARTGATVGKSFLIQGSIPDAVFASYLIRIVLKKEINAKFVYTFFQSQSYRMQIHQGKVGSGQPNVNAKILSQITLPLPPLPEQQAIVSEVESRLSVADKVEKTVTAELKRAEQLRQSILKKAFSGELVPQDPNDEPASVLLERIKAEKSQHIQEQFRLKIL